MKFTTFLFCTFLSLTAFGQENLCSTHTQNIEDSKVYISKIDNEISELRAKRNAGTITAQFANAMIDSAREHRSNVENAMDSDFAILRTFGCMN